MTKVFNYENTKTMAAVALSVLLVVTLNAGCAVGALSPPTEPPAIEVQYGDSAIEWVVGKNKWNGSAYGREDHFRLIMTDTVIEELPYIRNGESISIKINGNIPSSVVLAEHLITENGDKIFAILQGKPYDFCFGASSRTGVFTIEPNGAIAFSSSTAYYFPGALIKGYTLVCTWGGNECEYAFVIRGDAFFTITPTHSPQASP